MLEGHSRTQVSVGTISITGKERQLQHDVACGGAGEPCGEGEGKLEAVLGTVLSRILMTTGSKDITQNS